MESSAGHVLAYLLWMTGVGVFVWARWVGRGLSDVPVGAWLCWWLGGVVLAWASLGAPVLAVGAWVGGCLAAWGLWVRLVDVVQEWRGRRGRGVEAEGVGLRGVVREAVEAQVRRWEAEAVDAQIAGWERMTPPERMRARAAWEAAAVEAGTAEAAAAVEAREKAKLKAGRGPAQMFDRG